MHAVLALLERVATTDSPVLITGESGTGKTLLARAIHRLSGRVGPMVEADSTVLAESVLDVELFGHERGAFTGAVARKAGLIELAANGTLFIDDIGLLSAKLQSKLARALEHGSFFRVGGTQKVDITVRLVTSSNHDLEEAVQDGRFRDDLLYRLNTVTVSLPPLRERAVDIPLLAAAFPDAARRRVGADADAGRDRADAGVSVARQHPRAAHRHRARGAARADDGERRDSRAGSAAVAAPPSKPRASVGSTTTLAELERQHIEAVLDADELASGQRREDPRHLVEDALSQDSRVRISRPKRGAGARMRGRRGES